MKEYSFYALLLRMKYIQRWGLMRSSIPENLSEHALETAVIAHALAVIQNTYLGGGARLTGPFSSARSRIRSFTAM